MKKKIIATLLGFSMIGCVVPYAYADDAKTTTEQITEKTKNAIDQIKSYSIDKKEAAKEKAKELTEDIDHKIKVLEDSVADKTNNMTDAAREAKTKSIIKLKEKRNDVESWYKKLCNSTKNAWEEIKQGFIKSYDAFQDTYKDSDN